MSIEPITAVAVVGVGAILPDAPDALSFWANVRGGRYSITDVDPDRWDPAFYYDVNPKAPDKTYSKIGGWVRDWTWDPLGWKLPIPPRVGDAMDDAQKWAVACTRAALLDYGWPERSVDGERTAVVFGNAMSGEHHYLTALRIAYPELAHELDNAPTFQALPADVRKAVSAEFGELLGRRYPEITEDTMPGELGNCMAGRVANLFDLHGPNFVVDAACASALAAIDASVAGLLDHSYDTAIAGGVDRNMGASSYVKFCKIGALSATGTRPFDAGADGFVMGEGAGVFVLKRLADAERDGDRVYAVLRGIGGASDGRGKGITAPNPVGQRLAVQRAWRSSGVSPASCGLIECHGTSTRVGDVVEVTSIGDALSGADLQRGSVAIGSAKSNIGHLKAAAGAAGFLKAVMAIHHKELPPSLHVVELNPNIDWAASPFKVNTELRPWDPPTDGVRTAGVSAFGFGGTNFHAVLEEYVPGRLPTNGRRVVAVGADLAARKTAPATSVADAAPKTPLRGALVLGADDEATLVARLREVQAEVAAGRAPAPAPPLESDLHAAERVAIDYADAAELAAKVEQALAAFEQPVRWKVLRGRGVFRGSGPAPKVAFLYTGQGSQYVNMLAALRDVEPIVAETFDEADAIMKPLIGRPLTSYLFADPADPDAITAAEAELRKTEITQPAVLSVDLAITQLLASYGIVPDLVMGHSLGEYGALVAAGALTFPAALEAVSARGHEMAQLTVDDNGAMAAVFAPLLEIEKVVAETDGYVVIANVNSSAQAVIGGATAAVEAAVELCQQRGFQVAMLPVSHAFHTSIVAPASEPLRHTLERLELKPPKIPIVANVTGALYPMGPDVVPEMLDLLAAQVASPVQFVRGLRTLYDAGARLFVEVGPKKALQGFAADVLGDDVMALATNHPKLGDAAAFNQALCGLYAAGVGVGEFDRTPVAPTAVSETVVPAAAPAERSAEAAPCAEPVVITGAALGLPGAPHVFDDGNVARILHGEQGIDVIPTRIRHEIVGKHITRLVKGESGARFESIDSPADVIKLAGRAGEFDLGAEFGVDAEWIPALGRETQLAIGAGIDALRDAGIPLVHHRTTSVGSQLPDRWMLPDDERDTTGVIFASAFPGYNDLADELTRFGTDNARRAELAAMEAVRAKVVTTDGIETSLAEIDRRIHDLRRDLEEDAYTFDRRFLFRVLSMGHSQFAEQIGARGPNTQLNAACASTTQAVAMAEDWIRAGRCQRVVVVAADDVTSDHLLGWIGAGFLASGAAATDEDVQEAAVPFDRRRHGMILGMGAAALVVESAASARQRGIRPICEVLGAVTANSAFHGTRLDVDHIGHVMEEVVAQAEARGARREIMAPATVFISHETYTPARGGSAAAEVNALRRVFGAAADQVVVANTKGFTGHPMGVGIEDVVAVKALETGIVPPVPNFKEPDPDLGELNLSIGGVYPVRYALRLAAGFGSQISMTVLRWVPTPDGQHPNLDALGYAGRIAEPEVWQAWLARVSGDTDPRLEVDHRTLRVVARDAVRTTPERQSGPDRAPVVEQVPAAAAPVVAPAPVAPAGPSGEDVVARVIALVAEQTGYPPELLDLDLDLEADLGIDTVKQAELFAQVRESYGIEREDSLLLRDYPTLNHVIGFVRDRIPQPVVGATSAAAAAQPASAEPSVDDADFPRRVPVPVVRPPLEWFAPTGVRLDQDSRVVILPDNGGVAEALSAQLLDRGVDVLGVDMDADAPTVAAQVAEWLAAGPIEGLFALPALDNEGPIAELGIGEWREGLHRRVKLLAAVSRVMYDRLGEAGTFLVSATRNGGAHGYDQTGASSAMSGATSGFTKSLARERPAAVVKVLDVTANADVTEVASALVDETLRDGGVVEVGRRGAIRLAIGLDERPAAPADPARALGPDSVVVVTGAAGSIVSAIVVDLARASGGATFHLLDLIAEPDPADPDLAKYAGDRDGLKRELADRITARGERATPVLIERELAAIERRCAAQAAIDAVIAFGGTARWYSADLRDGEAMAEAAAAIGAANGRIDVLLHAGGLEISRLLPDKSPAEFDLVFDVKADGWFHLLHGLRDVPIGTALVFSSIAGRFGNGGQTDYSAANDLLCKSVSAFRSTRPGTRGVAIDWTAWSGIGMASRGSIPKMMALAGIDMLPAEVGIPVVRREVTAGGTGGELVVAGALGAMLCAAAPRPETSTGSNGAPLVGQVMPSDDGLVVLTELDPTVQPFLHDHRIDGTAVLPGVMGIEAFAEAARILAPGWEVAAVEDVEFLTPFKWYRDLPRRLEVHARAVPVGDGVVAECRLVGRRGLPGQAEQVTTHFTGRVVLSPTATDLGTWSPPAAAAGRVVTTDAIYRVFFHGPSYKVLAGVWRDGDTIVGELATDLPASHEGGPLVAAPRLVELCFQTAGVAQLATDGTLALPRRVGRLQVAPGAADTAVCWAVMTSNEGGGVGVAVVDGDGRVLVRLSGYDTVSLPGAVGADILEPLEAALR